MNLKYSINKRSLSLILFITMIGVSAIHQISFCMITAQRPNNISYVEQVMDTYLKQNIHIMDGVGIILIDVDGSTLGKGIRLADREKAICDTPDVEGLPSCQVRQRTLDVTKALSQCMKSTSGWVVLVEDDCEICPEALDEALTALSKLEPQKTAMAKLSKNMCATAFPDNMITPYIMSTLRRLYTHPHDIIYAEDWSSPPVFVYKHPRNLFHHIGTVSTEPHKNDPLWQEQYGEMRADTCGDKTIW